MCRIALDLARCAGGASRPAVVRSVVALVEELLRKSPLLRKAALIEPNRLRADDVLLIDREAVLEVKGPGAARSGEVPPTKVWLTIKKARS